MTTSFNYVKGLIALALPLLVGVGPCERMPGGVLNGAVVGEPVADWSKNEDLGLCALESRPEFPHSVTVACWQWNKDLYVGCMSCDGKIWSNYVSNDPRARIKIGDKVYPVKMNRIVDKDAMQQPWQARWEMRDGEGPAPSIPEPYWLYRLTSR